MKTNELREILKLYGLQHDVVINKSSRRYSIILDNNIIGTNHDKERMVVFRPIPEGKNTFCMERDRFYTEFEEVFDDDKAIEAVRQYFENNKKQKVMNENEVFRFKVRIAIPNLSRENKDMINSILDGINKKDEEEKGYLYTVRVKLNNGKVVHATLFSKDKKGPTFEDLKKELDDMGIKDDDYSDNGIIIINRIVMSGEEFDRFTGE